MVKKVQLPYVRARKRGGRVYYYFERKGQKAVRLPNNPDTPEFQSAYWDARGGRSIEARTSFRMLIESYRAGDRWAKLKPRTRKDYDGVLTYVLEKQGPRDFTVTTRRDVIEAMQANQHRKRFANYIAQVLSVMFEHAIDMGWMASNPAKGVKLSKTGDGYQPWPEWAIAAYRQSATGSDLLAFELALGTGQRAGDLCKMRWDDFDGEYVRVRQSKTDARLWVYCPPSLREALHSAPRAGLTILTNAKGQPLTYHALEGRVRRVRQEIGAMAYSLHGLRYSAAIEMAEGGVSDRDIMAVTGHKTAAMVTKYTAEARTRVRSKRAQEARDSRTNRE
jgi:integrase